MEKPSSKICNDENGQGEREEKEREENYLHMGICLMWVLGLRHPTHIENVQIIEPSSSKEVPFKRLPESRDREREITRFFTTKMK